MTTILIAILIVIVDRMTKSYATNALMHLPDGIPLWPGVIRLIYTENDGMAFGLLSGRLWLFTAATAIALLGAFLAYKKYRLTSLPKAALGLAVGGAVGNLFDRLLYGYVVDMFDFEFIRFAVFNVADAALCVGVGLLVISILFIPKTWEVRNDK